MVRWKPYPLHLILASLGTAILAGSCSSQPDLAVEKERYIDGDYPLLPGRFAEQGVSQPLIAAEAFIGNENFYVSYESVDGLVYAGGNWSNRIDLTPLVEGTTGTFGGPYILPLTYQQRERWPTIPEKPIVPRQLSADQWARFREGLFLSVLPKVSKVGVAMHFDTDDYFLFYNELGLFEARLLVEKPPDYQVAESISFGEFAQRGMPALKAFLAAEGVKERRVMFNTGDTGPYSLPFLYVDVDRPLAVFVRYAELRRPAASTEGTPAVQSVGHIAQSHLGGLAVRPVSSLFRLLFVVKDAAVETVTPSWLVSLNAEPIPEVSGGPGMDLAAWESQLNSLTGRPAMTGDIEFLIDGEEYFTDLIDELTSARESIHIRTYIFDNDDVAEKIGVLLRRRSGEGLDVKILLDGLGTIMATGATDESMPEDYQVPQSVRQFLEADSGIDVRQIRNPWFTGDHVKATIVDGQVAFTGGMNIGREYRYTWHDMMMKVRGPVVDVLSKEFHDAWAHAGFFGDVGYFVHKLKPNPDEAEHLGHPLRVLFTRPGNAEIFRAQREAIRNARSYIYVENAYFTDDAMLYELAKARRRGVDVRIVLPLAGDNGPINQSNVLAANAMLEHGIRVYIYPGMSHVKAAVFDGWACLGSANWDKLSLRTNKELNLATSHPDVVAELNRRLFATDFARSVELLEPFPARWSDHLTEVIADYLL